MARQDINEALAQTGFLYGGNAAYIEDLYARYQADPKSVDPEWQGFSAEAYIFAGPIYFAFCFFMSRYSVMLEREFNRAR